MFSIHLYPPGHPAHQHARRWYWEITSANEVYDCGATDSGDEAYEFARLALDRMEEVL